MKIDLYESYGVIAHEKTPVYSETIPASSAYDVITVDIPDQYPLSRNELGETLIDIDGVTWLLREVLKNKGDHPALRWFDGRRYHTIQLKTVRE
jgi:hypothetical protein